VFKVYFNNYFYLLQGGRFALWLCKPFLGPPQENKNVVSISKSRKFFIVNIFKVRLNF